MQKNLLSCKAEATTAICCHDQKDHEEVFASKSGNFLPLRPVAVR